MTRSQKSAGALTPDDRHMAAERAPWAGGEIGEWFGRTQQSQGGQWRGRERVQDFLSQEQEVLERLEREALENIRRQGIDLLETISVDQQRLAEMSVKGIPPFSEKTGDRGFKDTLILFSILADARRRKAAKEGSLVFTNDSRIVDAIRELPEAHELGITVARSFRDAIELLEKFQTAQELRIQRRRVEDLRKFLLAHKDEISKFIRHARAFAVLRDDEKYGQTVDLDMWRTIKSIDVAEIEEPVLGELPESDQGRVSISFIVKVMVTSAVTGLWSSGRDATNRLPMVQR